MTKKTTSDLVVANIRIDVNQRMSGSHELKKTEPMKNIPQKQECDRDEVSPLTFVSPNAYKLILHLDEKRVTQDMIKNLDPKLRVTKGLVMIKYIPTTDKRRVKGRPFQIGQDLIRMRINVAGPRHWHYLCNKIPELKWLERNSTLSDIYFDLAVKHPGVCFWCNVDWAQYYNKLKDQPIPDSEEGRDRPFGARKCSAEEYRANYKDKTASIRVLNDVIKEVREVESMPEVQEEMLARTGETGKTYDHNFENYKRDPKTGRWTKEE